MQMRFCWFQTNVSWMVLFACVCITNATQRNSFLLSVDICVRCACTQVYINFHSFIHTSARARPCVCLCVDVSMCIKFISFSLFLYLILHIFNHFFHFACNIEPHFISFHFQLVWFHICSMVLLVLWVCSMPPPMSTLAGHFVSIYSSANP